MMNQISESKHPDLAYFMLMVFNEEIAGFQISIILPGMIITGNLPSKDKLDRASGRGLSLEQGAKILSELKKLPAPTTIPDRVFLTDVVINCGGNVTETNFISILIYDILTWYRPHQKI